MSNIPLKENGSHTCYRYDSRNPFPRLGHTIDQDINNNEDKPLRCVDQSNKQKSWHRPF